MMPFARFAPSAPMPTDLERCRWCGRRLRGVLPDRPRGYCESGCAPNEIAPFKGHCHECHREFMTGKHVVPALCHECDAAERARFIEPPAVERVYSWKRWTRGRWMS